MSMRTLLLKGLAALGIVLTILIVFRAVATQAIRRQLAAFVNGNCESCTLSLDRVRLAVLPPSIILEGVSLSGGDYETTKVDAEIERIVAPSTFRNLLSGKLNFKKIQAHGARVVVTEGDLPVPPPGPEEGTRAVCVIEGMEVTAGSFTYIRVFGSSKDARKAILHVKDIRASVGELGTTPQLREQKVHGKANGRLEDSGAFVLTVETAPFSKILHVDVDLQMTEQNLADVSPFFQTADGVRMTGRLHRGKSSIHVRQERLTGSVQAEYEGLKLHMETTGERGKVSAFFTNLVNSVKFRSSNSGKRPADQIRDVDLQREPRETLINFILRGMKEGAVKVAGNP